MDVHCKSNLFDTVYTGDVFLCSNNTATGFLLRTATSSKWNHVGIAIRLNKDKKITSNLTDSVLYMLELNADKRYDILTDSIINGLTLTEVAWFKQRYNRISIRRLKKEYLSEGFIQKADKFISKHHGAKFSPSLVPFIGVWWGIPVAGDKRRSEEGKREFFCSEMMAVFYRYCLGLELDEIFGKNAPDQPCLYLPGHFSVERTPRCLIFSDDEEILHISYADAGIVLLQPFLLILLLMTILSMLLV